MKHITIEGISEVFPWLCYMADIETVDECKVIKTYVFPHDTFASLGFEGSRSLVIVSLGRSDENASDWFYFFLEGIGGFLTTERLEQIDRLVLEDSLVNFRSEDFEFIVKQKTQRDIRVAWQTGGGVVLRDFDTNKLYATLAEIGVESTVAKEKRLFSYESSFFLFGHPNIVLCAPEDMEWSLHFVDLEKMKHTCVHDNYGQHASEQKAAALVRNIIAKTDEAEVAKELDSQLYLRFRELD